MRESDLTAKYFSVQPQLKTIGDKRTPHRMFNNYIKENAKIITRKPVKGDFNYLSKYFKEVRPNYGILCDFPFFDPKLSSLFTQKLFLAHPSNLPDFAGPDAISNALFDSKEATGVTITNVEQDFDLYQNNIISRVEVGIDQADTYTDLANKLGHQAGIQLHDIIAHIHGNKKLELNINKCDPLPCKALDRIFTVEELEAETITRLYRALDGSNYPPATFADIDGEFVMMSFISPEIEESSEILSLLEKEAPGTMGWKFEVDPDAVYVKCRKGCIKSSGMRVMQARKQLKDFKAKNLVKYYLSKRGKTKMDKEGTKSIFKTTKQAREFSDYKNIVDKRFEYMAEI